MTRILTALGLATALLSTVPAMAAEKTVTLAVDNMYCASCPFIVKKSLAKVEGVDQVGVSFEKKIATVTYDDKKTTVPALIEATTQAGYPSHLTAESSAAATK